ncbi:DNA repair protein RadC [Paenibacillus yonginensis]|uniref:DNA repair protein RadC n=1 Tax=Paenibacillus yonginensis TaxID=1462996 RepID=A0A1B1N3W4_9BACL|nr:DNA repair protein RadC [Paenibacillus yonginensis]ANS76123.1 DNA repair protein RadC [Paenibacillus yonginensis]
MDQIHSGELEAKKLPQRSNIVSVKLVKESILPYNEGSIRSPEDGYKLMKYFLADLDREAFLVVNLDTKNSPVSINVCHIGTLNATIVHPREVMKAAILSNASSIIVGHNHPSGNSSPSQEDISTTERLAEAGKIIGIELLDHIIVGNDNFVSLKTRGYI